MAEAEATTETELAPERARELIEAGAQVVDVRSHYEHEAGHIAGDRHMPLVELDADAQQLDREKPVILYCRSGDRSGMAADALRASGWEAYSVAGGLVAWAEAGLPLEPEGGEVAVRPNLPGA